MCFSTRSIKGNFRRLVLSACRKQTIVSLIVLVDWVGFEVDERTWEPFTEIFEATPEFLAKELRKLRVTRAIAARIKRDFFFVWYSIVIFSTSLRCLCIKLVARNYSSNALWGCFDEIRLSVEFVTVGFLRICRHSCCDRFPGIRGWCPGVLMRLRLKGEHSD